MADLPTAKQLDEFRNVAVMSRAYHRRDFDELNILLQLINDPDAHVMALRSFIECLLVELDGNKRNSDEVLSFIIEQAAMAESRG